MGRRFNIPLYYRSSIISNLKTARNTSDPRKNDLSPTELSIGALKIKIARHFGFCFGVENAIEIAYRALAENPDRRVFLLSEMIHNPQVNADLQTRGVRFLLSPEGAQLIPFAELVPNDIVIVPAFGTTRELFMQLGSLGIDLRQYNATCPFVEKVWKRSQQLGDRGYTVIIHGKHYHEETRATFSHARTAAPSLVIRDHAEAERLAQYIRGALPRENFFIDFESRCSQHFDPQRDLSRIGVVNQTTMLAHETQGISEYLRGVMLEVYGRESIDEHFADTRDTLCYATSENQDAIRGMVDSGGDVALVVGGYNSSNTFHLAKLCAERVPTYYIKDAEEIISLDAIRHFDLERREVVEGASWLPPEKRSLTLLLTAGASCPDAVVDQVLLRLAGFWGVSSEVEPAVKTCLARYVSASAADSSVTSVG